MAAWSRALVGVLALLALSRVLGLADGLDRWITDSHWRWAARLRPREVPPEIVIVAVDDRTVREKGRLSNWRRTEYAALLGRLREARAVGFDILFTEPDLRWPQDDAALAAAIRRQGRVVLPFYLWKESRPVGQASLAEGRKLLDRLPRATPALAAAIRHPDPRAVNPDYLESPAPALRDAAAGLGYADIASDADGVYRKAGLVRVTWDGVALPHFVLVLAAIADGTSLSEVLQPAPGSLHFGARSLPLTEANLALRAFCRSRGTARGLGRQVPTVSFVEALDSDPSKFAGKIVLVGETATGTTDIRPNPLDASLRGVELNAEILANVLQTDPVGPMPDAAQWVLVALAVGLPLWLFSAYAPAKATLLAGLTFMAIAAAMESAFWLISALPPWAPVAVGLFGSTLLMGLQRLAQEETQKRQIRQSFSLYVPPEQVEAIVQDPQIAHQQGTRMRVAVLFSDIRSFTTYSEQNPPELVVRQMGEYLGEMTESVHAHHGILDKFIGDEVMALWGPFLEVDAPEGGLAVACALDMVERLERLNRKWTQEEKPIFRIGIGIHMGDAIVGNIVTPLRTQYTALGDTVNLAARLQTATKDLKVVLLVSEAVKEQCGALASRVEFRDRGELTVRGREQAVRVYEVWRSKTPEGMTDAAE